MCKCRPCCKYTPAGDVIVCDICEKWGQEQLYRFCLFEHNIRAEKLLQNYYIPLSEVGRFWSRHSYKSRAYAEKKSSPRVVLSPVVVPHLDPVAKSVSKAGSVRSDPLRSPATKSTVSLKAARSVD